LGGNNPNQACLPAKPSQAQPSLVGGYAQVIEPKYLHVCLSFQVTEPKHFRRHVQATLLLL